MGNVCVCPWPIAYASIAQTLTNAITSKNNLSKPQQHVKSLISSAPFEQIQKISIARRTHLATNSWYKIANGRVQNRILVIETTGKCLWFLCMDAPCQRNDTHHFLLDLARETVAKHSCQQIYSRGGWYHRQVAWRSRGNAVASRIR